MVIMKEESARRSEEQVLCEELRKRGLRPIPSYTLIPTDQVQDREKALAAIQASGAVAVFALRPVAVNKQQTYVPPTYMGARGRTAAGARTMATGGTRPTARATW